MNACGRELGKEDSHVCSLEVYCAELTNGSVVAAVISSHTRRKAMYEEVETDGSSLRAFQPVLR